MELIKGKVAAIKSDYAIIINKGYEDGVEEDMKFVIYEEGDEITDPDTEESLGRLEYYKAKVKVINPSEKYSWAETYGTYSVNEVARWAAALSAQTTRQERIKLPLEESIVVPKTSRIVKVGDSVRQIIG
jgi:hypothetical protein